MLNALVIVWRESLEGLLVIGVLLSWIVRQAEPRLLKGSPQNSEKIVR